MKIKSFIIVAAFILWSICCTYIYVYKIKKINLSSITKLEIEKPRIVSYNEKYIKNTATYSPSLHLTINFSGSNIFPNELDFNDSLLNKIFLFQVKNGEKLNITGYANKQNNPKQNYKLGRIRAWVIKRMLLEKGIKSEYLITSANSNADSNIVVISSENNLK